MWSSWLWCQSSYKITLSVFTVNFLRPQCMVGELPSWPSSDWNWEHMSQRVRDLAIEWQLSILASNNVQSSASRHQCSAAVANIVTYLFAFCVLCGTRLVSFCLWAPTNESTVTRLVAYVSLCICCFNALTFKSLDTKRSFFDMQVHIQNLHMKFVFQGYRVNVKATGAKKREMSSRLPQASWKTWHSVTAIAVTASPFCHSGEPQQAAFADFI